MTLQASTARKQSAIDPVEMTVAEVQAAFSQGDLTSEALTQAYLDRDRAV